MDKLLRRYYFYILLNNSKPKSTKETKQVFIDFLFAHNDHVKIPIVYLHPMVLWCITWDASGSKGLARDITVAQGTPSGGSFHFPINEPTKVPIYLLKFAHFRAAQA